MEPALTGLMIRYIAKDFDESVISTHWVYEDAYNAFLERHPEFDRDSIQYFIDTEEIRFTVCPDSVYEGMISMKAVNQYRDIYNFLRRAPRQFRVHYLVNSCRILLSPTKWKDSNIIQRKPLNVTLEPPLSG